MGAGGAGQRIRTALNLSTKQVPSLDEPDQQHMKVRMKKRRWMFSPLDNPATTTRTGANEGSWTPANLCTNEDDHRWRTGTQLTGRDSDPR
jgi:hypothetical protein